MELTYTKVGDYYIPDLVLAPEPEPENSMASMAICGESMSGSIGPHCGYHW